MKTITKRYYLGENEYMNQEYDFDCFSNDFREYEKDFIKFFKPSIRQVVENNLLTLDCYYGENYASLDGFFDLLIDIEIHKNKRKSDLLWFNKIMKALKTPNLTYKKIAKLELL